MAWGGDGGGGGGVELAAGVGVTKAEGGGGGSGGNGGTSTASATANSTDGNVTASASATGGNGGAGSFNAAGGQGATVSLNNAVGGSTTANVTLTETTVGGNGGNSAGAVPADPLQPAYMALFEPAAEGGRTSFAAGPHLQTRMGFKRRGSSTINDPKSSYTVETWDERNDDKDVPVLGMPPGSDWVLYGAYSFDLALMRNALIYELSNQVGRYAVRTRFCEVFVNRVGGSLAYGDYMGVYSFMERIKRGKERVNVERLTAGDTAVPAITGGYMLKVDRRDPGDAGLSAGGQPSLCYVYPDEQYIRGTPQAAWIKNYLDSFAAALNGANFRDPVLGYAPYVDQASWIDHHILNVLPMNVDALRLSTYFYKARGKPIEYGPIWDFDRSMGSTDSRDDNPYAWNGTGDSSIYFTYDARYPWWSRLFADDDFMQLWKDRWFRFRQGPLSTANMHAVIDRFHAVIEEAATRNFTRWPLIRPNQFLAQINVLKTWLAQRAGWIDSQFLTCLLYTSPSPRDRTRYRMPSSA